MSLEEVKECVNLIESDKITVRKEAAIRLTSLLNNDTIILTLNDISKKKRKGSLCWATIFEASKKFLIKEAKKLENAERSNENPTASIKLGWENSKRKASSLSKFILKKACSYSESHINAKSLIDFIFMILDKRNNPFLLENFSGDAIQIVQKYILHYPQYYLYVSQFQWKDLLQFCIWIYENDAGNVDPVAIISVIEGIVKYFRMSRSTIQFLSPSVALRSLPGFLIKSINSKKISKQYGAEAAFLSLLYTISIEFGSQWRRFLVHIGEDTLPTFLRLWECKPTQRQKLLIQYINLQLIMHSPQRDGKIILTSLLCQEKLVWQKCLYQIYLLIFDYLNVVDQDSRMTSSLASQENSNILDDVTTLSARLISQIFSTFDTNTCLNITQVGPDEYYSQNISLTQRNKRRKVEISFGALIEFLKEEGTEIGRITWFQIFSKMMQDHRYFFTSSIGDQLLDLLLYLLCRSKNSLVINALLKCLNCLSNLSFSLHLQSRTNNANEKWCKVCDHTLRLIAGKHCSATGMLLLKTLIKNNTTHTGIDSTIYRFFCRNVIHISKETLELLETLFLYFPLPKAIVNDEYMPNAQRALDFKEMILKLLFPLLDDLDPASETCLDIAIHHPEILSRILSLLSSQDPQNSCRSVVYDWKSQPSKPALLELEELYMKSSLCHFEDFFPERLNPSIEIERYSKEAQEKIIICFIRFVNQYTLSNTSRINKEACLIILDSIKLSIISPLLFNDARLQDISQQCLHLPTFIEPLLSSKDPSAWEDFVEIIKSLNYIFETAIEKVNVDKSNSKYLIHLLMNLPQSFQDKLLCIYKTREQNSPKNSFDECIDGSQTQKNNSTQRRAFDELFDSDFEELGDIDVTISTQNNFEEFDIEGSLSGWSPENCTPKFISSSSLSSKDYGILQVSKLLGYIFSLNAECNFGIDDDNSPFVRIIEFFLKLGDSEEFEDLSLTLTFVNFLFQMKYNSENIFEGIEIISKISAKSADDPRIAVAVIQCLKVLLGTCGSQLINDQKANVIHLLKAFALKFKDGHYGMHIGQTLFDVIVQLTMIDPLRCWSSFTISIEDRSSEMYNLLRCPYYDLRMKVSEYLPYLFAFDADPLKPLPLDHQMSQFQKVYQVAIESLSIEAQLAAELTVDERICRVTSFFSCLLMVAYASPYLEPKVLFVILSSVKIHRVDSVVVQRAVNKLASRRKLSICEYMKGHLIYLLSQWSHDKHTLDEFPYFILNCDRLPSFLKEYSTFIVVALFQQDLQDQIEDILALKTGVKICILLEQNFSYLFASILPYLMAASFEDDLRFKVPKSKIITAKKKWKYLECTLGVEKLASLIEISVSSIVLTLLKMSHDPTKWAENEVVIEPSGFHLNSDLVVATLSAAHLVFYKNKSSIILCLAEQKLSLHSILQGLFLELAICSEPHKSRWALAKLETLLKILLPSLGRELLTQNVFIIRKLTTYLSHYSIEYTTKEFVILAEKCNVLLLSIINTCINIDCSFLSSSIPFLIPRLFKLYINKQVWSSSCQVLAAIFNCENTNLKSILAALPPISISSDIPQLDDLVTKHRIIINQIKGRVCLRKIIEEFIQIATEDVTTFYLRFLSDVLSEKHGEICELYSSTNLKGEKLAHSFIQRIVALITVTKDKNRALLGAECLGKLGPFNLEKDVFALEKNENSEGFSQTLFHLYRLAFLPDVVIVDAASNALMLLLQTKLGFTEFKTLNDQDLTIHLAPFIPRQKPIGSTRQFQDLEINAYELLLNNDDIWEITDSFESWIKSLTITILEAGCGCDFFSYIIPVCKLNATFCEQVLPYVFHFMLLVDPVNRRRILSRKIKCFINKLSLRLYSPVPNLSGSNDLKYSSTLHMCKSALRTFINIINYLRTKNVDICFSGRSKNSCWERNFWLDLDYLQLSKAAFLCGSHFSAILFAEIACHMIEQQLDASIEEDDLESFSKIIYRRQIPPLQRVAESIHGEEISSLLLQVYNTLEMSDGVEGCSGASFSTNCVVQSTLNLHRGKYLQSLGISDAGNDMKGLVDSLRLTGMYNILHSHTSQNVESKYVDARAECCWRLGKWDNNEKSDSNESFHQSFFQALLNLRNKDLSNAKRCKEGFLLKTVAFLQENGNESTSSIYPILSQLQIYAEFEEISKILTLTSDNEIITQLINIESKWEEKDSCGVISSQQKELMLAARIAMLNSLLASLEAHKESVQSLLFKCLLKKCKLSHTLQLENVSQYEIALLEAKKLQLSTEQSWQLMAEEVHLAVCLNNPAQALRSLDKLRNDIKPKLNDGNLKALEQYFKSTILYGEILVKSRTRSPGSVIDEYFLPAIWDIKLKSGLLGSNCNKLLEKSYHKLAELGNRLYEEVNINLSSDYYEERIRQLDKSKSEVKRAKEVKNDNPQEENQLRKKIHELSMHIKREENEIEKHKEDASKFLIIALENYFKCLSCSSARSLSMFKIVSLWFENLLSAKVNQVVAQSSTKIKSHLFIPLMYQLVARLCGESDSSKHNQNFPSTLAAIIERVCMEHPYHSLPSLLMLAHAHLDEEFQAAYCQGGQKSSNRNISNQHPVAEEERVQAAKAMVKRLKNSRLVDHICELEKVCSAYISLSICISREMKKDQRPPKENTQIPFNKNYQIMKLKNLEHTAPLTRHITVQPSGSYSPPLILNWDSSGYYVGGINAPIKLCVNSSDGVKANELLKGNDDLRQDAVLEQVFNVVNELLSKDEEAKKKKLNVRTYIVIPLSQKFGILQWCDNTDTLVSFFKDAHAKYYPSEDNFNQIRNRMVAVKGELDNVKIKTFEAILKEFHPVFRYFFYEKYPKPEKWFTMREAYTRSVATSSITGYILGLGDRHVNNLLLDVETAEVIHIDLGIAFDKGALLPTPERVPFRMTQNIVDGFGVLGVEGPLRKGMETTLRVLREANSVLVTIVEVFKHDPLHQWTLSPKQIAKIRKQKQKSTSQEISINSDSNTVSLAERALVRVQQKLNGLQDGQVLSVPEHVSVLIQQATDISNLAVMFHGWQPYL